MKRLLSVVLTAALAGCGGNVRVDDPTGVQAEIAAAVGEVTAVLFVTEGGSLGFVETESLSVRDQAATRERWAPRWGENATLTRAGERGGLPHYVGRGSVSGLPEFGTLVKIEVGSYGAWGEHQTFSVWGMTGGTAARWMTGIAREVGAEFWSISGGRFSESNPVGEGTATWKGAMIGEWGDKFLSGELTLVHDFSSATVDVSMTGIRDRNTPQTYPDKFWRGLDVRDGTFKDVRPTIRGTFYGPNHEEAGGVFVLGGVTGAFGAKRQADE